MERSGRRRSRAVKVTVAVVGFFIFFPLTVFFVGVGPIDIGPASRDLEDAVTAYRAEGLPWEAKDLRPNPPIADDENAAPLIEKAAPFFDFKSKTWSRDSEAMGKSADSGDYKALSAELAPYDKALDMGAKAAKMKGVDFHYDWDLGPDLGLPQFSCLRNLSKGLCYRARIAAAKGDVTGATRNLELSLKLADFSGRVPTIIGVLVEVANQANAYQTYTQCAALFKDDPAALGALRASLEGYHGRADFFLGLRGEQYMGIAFIRNLDQFGGLAGVLRSSQGTYDPDEAPPPKADPAKLQRTGLPSGMWARAFLDHHLRYWTKYAETLRVNKDDVDKAAAKIDLATRLNRPRSLSGLIDEVLLPVFSQAGQSVKRADASRDCTLALIEALQIRASTGKMPTSIGEIPGTWVDPFGKGPLHLKTDGKSIRIYSLGPSLKDYGGSDQIEGASYEESNIAAAYPPLRRRHSHGATPPPKPPLTRHEPAQPKT